MFWGLDHFSRKTLWSGILGGGWEIIHIKLYRKIYISMPVFLAACNDGPTVLEPRAMIGPVQSHLLN